MPELAGRSLPKCASQLRQLALACRLSSAPQRPCWGQPRVRRVPARSARITVAVLETKRVERPVREESRTTGPKHTEHAEHDAHAETSDEAQHTAVDSQQVVQHSTRGGPHAAFTLGLEASSHVHPAPVLAQYPAPDVELLFSDKHLEGLPISFLLYFPLGCVLAALRMGIWVAMLALDVPWLTDNDFVIKFLQGVLGVQVDWVNSERIPRQRHVLVSNHVTAGDLMMLYRRPHHYVHLISAALPQAVVKAKNHRVRLVYASLDSYDTLANPEQTDSIHLFPEGGMTNGRGMMRFSRGFMRFAKDLPVVPVALRCTAPWGLQTHTLNSSFLANMFWFCFLPWVRLEATVLEPCSLREGEGKAAFVERVQRMIGAELQLGICDITLQQKRQMVAKQAK